MATLTSTKPVELTAAKAGIGRLMSLDIFRGATIAAMILVNNNGGDAAYWPLKHARWNGWTPTDLIFPFFVFIVGVSLLFSFQSRLKHGGSRHAIMLHSLKRSAILFALGLFVNAYPHFHLATWRIPGVLQRIAVAYLVAALLTLYARTATRIVWIVGLLAGYYILMRFVPVPGHGVPGRDILLLHPDWNLAAYIDRKLMLGHLYEGTRDPEGVLSTLPAIASALLGVLTGEWLRTNRGQREKVVGMVFAGLIGVIAGYIWNSWFPINKKLWTSSYVLLVAGLALLCLAFCYWLTDIQMRRGSWTKPFLIFGMNAITAYVFSETLSATLDNLHMQLGSKAVNLQQYIFATIFARIPSSGIASLAYSLGFVFVCFLVVWWMYRRKIFLKV